MRPIGHEQSNPLVLSTCFFEDLTRTCPPFSFVEDQRSSIARVFEARRRQRGVHRVSKKARISQRATPALRGRSRWAPA